MRLLLVVATLAVVAGAVTLGVGLMQPAASGWFAYAPLSGESFVPTGVHLVFTAALVSAGVLAVGVVALGLWWGIRIGRRRDDA
nr:cbb3-type cytochrome c oxidase subunit I [Clavibacter sp. VKM Ac-2873]